MNEPLERDLFVRRARALGSEAVPSLAAVLREADAGRDRSMPRARVAAGLALAAACFAATVTAMPRASEPRAITAETTDAGLPARAAIERGAACSDDEANACSSDRAYASIEVGACVAPAATFSAYAPAGPLACEREMACSIAGP